MAQDRDDSTRLDAVAGLDDTQPLMYLAGGSRMILPMPTTIYAILARSANAGRDVPASVKGTYKDIQPGTMALLTLLRGTGKQAAMIHVAWRTMDHDQPSDVMTIDEAQRCFNII